MSRHGERGEDVTERTVRVPIPTRAKGSRSWQPYRMTGLPVVTAREARLLKQLAYALPEVFEMGPQFAKVHARVGELLGAKLEVAVDSVQMVAATDLARYVGNPTFAAVLVSEPSKPRSFFEIELGLAHAAVDAMLGGSGEAVAVRRLTDIEEGLLMYLMLEVLKAWADGPELGVPRLRLERVAKGVDDMVGSLADETHVLVRQLRVKYGKTSGFWRFYLPASLLDSGRSTRDAASARATLSSNLARNGARLSGVRSTLRAEIGLVAISAGDLAGLSPGDWVMTGDLTARCDKGAAGTVELKVGKGFAGAAAAKVALVGGSYRATVTGFVAPHRPQAAVKEEDAAQAEEAEAESAGDDERVDSVSEGADVAAGQDLLSDVPMQLAIELARVPVTAEEIVALKVGHVIDLAKGAGAPVDLSVNGKIVARGELVEVDGNLGVRIVSLAG